MDSQVPRDTKQLVAGVAALKAAVRYISHLVFICQVTDKHSDFSVLQEPETVDDILLHIQSIVDEARRALSDPELPREHLLSALSVRPH